MVHALAGLDIEKHMNSGRGIVLLASDASGLGDAGSHLQQVGSSGAVLVLLVVVE